LVDTTTAKLEQPNMISNHRCPGLELLQEVEVVTVRVLQADHAGAPRLILRLSIERHARFSQSRVVAVDVGDRKANVIDARSIFEQPEFPTDWS